MSDSFINRRNISFMPEIKFPSGALVLCEDNRRFNKYGFMVTDASDWDAMVDE